MKNPHMLHPETLAAIVEDLQDMMHLDSGDRYVLDKELGGADVIQDLSLLLEKHGLRPLHDNDTRSPIEDHNDADVKFRCPVCAGLMRIIESVDELGNTVRDYKHI